VLAVDGVDENFLKKRAPTLEGERTEVPSHLDTIFPAADTNLCGENIEHYLHIKTIK
jgi:hypothetical protein